MRRRNPYNFERGEHPIGLAGGPDGIVAMTDRRTYVLRWTDETGQGLTRPRFIPIEIEQPKTRKVT